MSSSDLVQFPRWTVDITRGGVYLFSPKGEWNLGAIEAGRVGREWFEAINGTAGYLGYAPVEGWGFRLLDEYRGKPGARQAAEFTHEASGQRVVLYFKHPLPEGIEDELPAQLAGENRLEEYEYAEQGRVLDPDAQRRAEGGSRGAAEDGAGGLRGEGREALASQFRWRSITEQVAA